MITIFNPEEQKWPIKVWLENEEQIGEDCLQQAKNLSNLPFLHQWVVLMPDTHSGCGMPIGGVIAAEKVIIPNAVGVDIGCGMSFVQTNVPVERLIEIETSNGKLAQAIAGDILRNIPTGFEHHKKKQQCESVARFLDGLTPEEKETMPQELMKELDGAAYQVGTLGGGNHFIELQTDDQGKLGIMLHSGSRNMGFKICHYFNDLATEVNRKDQSPVPPEWDLAYFSTDSDLGKLYLRWMKLAMDFAEENRNQMMEKVLDIVRLWVKKYAGINHVNLSDAVHCHHNYAALEEHYGKQVWVHRKGAIRAGTGEMGIIPGAMGTYSYLVKGKGNPESFQSCSHGAGRRMSRLDAREQFSVQDTILDLRALGVFLAKAKRTYVGTESRFAYKAIDFVLSQELDLVEPVRRLKTVAVVKG